MIVGPYGLGRFAADYPFLDYATFADPEDVTGIAELGIVFLLFTLGLETSFEKLWTLRKYVLGAGSLQVILSALAIGAIAALFGNSTEVAIVIGLAFALSSTAIVMQLLYENHRVATPVGRMALSILLMQDLMVIPILFVVGLLAAGASASAGVALLEALALAGVAVVLILFVGRYALRPLLRLTAGTGSRDVFVAIVLLIMGAIALMTSAAGLSLALGAFLAGLLLSESEYRHQIEVDIEPFRGLLLGLFFMTVGMGIDPVAIWDDIIWLLGVALAVIVLKAAILFAVFIAFRVKRDTAAETALLLGQAGEFVFVVLALARSSGTVSAQTAQFFILVASTTMILTPLLAKLASRAGQAMRSEPDTSDSAPPTGADLEGHVIIGGSGASGGSWRACWSWRTCPTSRWTWTSRRSSGRGAKGTTYISATPAASISSSGSVARNRRPSSSRWTNPRRPSAWPPTRARSRRRRWCSRAPRTMRTPTVSPRSASTGSFPRRWRGACGLPTGCWRGWATRARRRKSSLATSAKTKSG